MSLAQAFKNYGEAVNADQRIQRLLDALTPYLFDGTETFRTINAELRDPENEIAASNIRHAVLSQYRNCASADIIVEIISKLLDEGKLP